MVDQDSTSSGERGHVHPRRAQHLHGSDSRESANAEIVLWFPEGINKYSRPQDVFIYE